MRHFGFALSMPESLQFWLVSLAQTNVIYQIMVVPGTHH